MSVLLASFQLLELNIISAQDLYRASGSMKTYAVAWVHPDRKLTTGVDSQGGTNPTWNDKFVFRVDDDFMNADTSAIMIEIYAVHWLKNVCVGSVRVLVDNLIPASLRNHRETRFVALQVRRLSGRPQGILNVGVGLIDSSMRSMPLYTQLSSSVVNYRDLVGEGNKKHKNHKVVDDDYGNNPQPLAPKPELRRIKSDSSSMIGPAIKARLKKDAANKKAGSIIGSSVVGEPTKKGKKASSAVNGYDVEKPTKKPKGGKGSSLLSGSGLSKPMKIFGVQKKGFGRRPIITESELGPSPSEVAAAIAQQPYEPEESSIIESRWGLDQCEEDLESKLERWRAELPAVYDTSFDHPGDRKRRNTRRREQSGDGVFSCFSNVCGCQCSIVCGAHGDSGRKKKPGNRRIRSSPQNDSYV